MKPATQDDFAVSAVNKVRRIPQRGHYDKKSVFEVVDAALVAHVGFVEDGRPVVIPMTCARMGEDLLIHGARKSRIMDSMDGFPVCITLTLLDGMVYARSIFHSSMNYRSAVIHGHARSIDDPDEKLRALEVMAEHLMPGRWAEVRPPLAKELKATQVMRIAIDFASAKIRNVGVLDDVDDYTPEQWSSTWAGLLPLVARFGTPETADTSSALAVAPSVLARVD